MAAYQKFLQCSSHFGLELLKNAKYDNVITCPSSVSSLFGKVVRREKAVPEYCGLSNRISFECWC